MARFSRIEVVQQMGATGMVPVFYHKDLEVNKAILKACYDGGARVFEFTNRGDFAHEIFGELVKWGAVHTPEMILGVGSVVDPATTALYLQLGANFIVSPILSAEMAKICNRRKVAWSPGCGSLTEISKAEELGAEVVKIFPGQQVGGPEFVKAIKGPFPWSSIMPTGGVSPTRENLTAWFNAGVHCVGMGSKLMKKDPEGNFDTMAIRAATAEALAVIAEVKG
ncbi:bifunctional 4-hydroxy-2-oxoglutarate aldolase/2-dehydro-3-deoxy-phosphogluconate aldolase [Persicobacter diffluens]|uniref:Bifunctional 4-hydroxy-2-oxoglutarate aldolase/2-dehydro-3-deoxy-phosphogluconate aldolase n=1 Tax=Persicobacter diffluens TaxID=981 RepID=A0AAN5APV1_9BACT|nr:bifunctional 4-hydroxy-2-oxoglutarate aldolase/2-dehydro-3-deoxy-phosphogluconate aldolase [Persicobacter diffluens]